MAMAQVKRQQNITEVSEKKIKILKTTFDNKKIISCLETLSNELFYEIFEYLEGCQLYETFSNLNIRFQNLLNSPFMQLKINLNSNYKWNLNSRSHIVTSNRHRILSLHLINSLWSNAVFPLFTIDSSFTHLESLQLCSIEPDQLISLLIESISLPRLFSLTIKNNYELLDITNVCRIVFILPVLKYFKLSYSSSITYIDQPINTNGNLSNIKHLVIDRRCNLDELMNILAHTPRLTRFTCTKLQGYHREIIKESLHTISSLTHIFIDVCHIPFDDMEIFITKVSLQLQVLRVNNFGSPYYLDAERWERIISEHLPHLRVFEFKYQECIKDYFLPSKYHSMINRFNSSFWTKKKWFFRLIIDKDNWGGDIIAYSIFPYRERQVNLHQDRNLICYDHHSVMQPVIVLNEIKSDDSFKIFSEINQLVVVDYYSIDQYLPIIMAPIFNMISISCLNIIRNEIFIGTLINFIKYLPHLDSLVVSSLGITHRTYLSDEEQETLRLVANNNKITKVNFQQVNNLTEVQLLLELCPCIEYLEVDCTNDVFVESIVRFTLMQNIADIPNLSLLCLKASKMNENIIRKIKEIIDIEPLRHSYTIKQLDNRIYLRRD